MKSPGRKTLILAAVVVICATAFVVYLACRPRIEVDPSLSPADVRQITRAVSDFRSRLVKDAIKKRDFDLFRRLVLWKTYRIHSGHGEASALYGPAFYSGKVFVVLQPDPAKGWRVGDVRFIDSSGK